MRSSWAVLRTVAVVGLACCSHAAFAAAPTLTNVEATALTYAENGPATPITAGITVSDADSPTLFSGTVSVITNFTSGEDVLNFVNDGFTMGNIVGAYDAGTLVLTSAGGTATIAEWQAALRAVTYRNTSDNPNTLTRTIRFSVNDGTSGSNTPTRDINVTAVNDAPVLAAIEPGALAATENVAVFVTGSITVSDVDNVNLASATAQVTGNYQNGEDELNASGLPGGITATFDAPTGKLTLTGSTTVANYQTALRLVQYTNTSDTPNTALTRTVTFTVNDGAANSNPQTRDINVTAANDTPRLTGIEGAALNYTENGAPAAITASLIVADPENPTLPSGTVSISGNFAVGQDVLGFINNPATMGNIAGGYNAGTGVLALTSAGATATLAEWQAALRAVTYSNTSDNPNTAARTIRFVLNDGTGDGSAATRNISVIPVNDAPVLANIEPAALVYGVRAGAGAMAITSSLTIGEVDSTTLASGTVRISANFVPTEDVLAFVNDLGTMGNISGSFAGDTLTLISAGPTATLTQWRAALRAVTYTNTNGTSTNPLPRTVTLTVNDGTTNSNMQTRNITIAYANDAPSFAKGPDQAVVENAPAQTVPGWATNIVLGPSGPPDDESGQSVLAFNVLNNTNAALFSVQPAISATGELTYTPAAGIFGTATITIELQEDGGTAFGGVDTSPPQTFVITVNDRPSFTKGADELVAEDTGLHAVAGWATSISAGPAPQQGAQVLHFNVTNNTNPALFSIAPALSTGGELAYTLAANAFGTATITITLQDDGGGLDTSAPQTFDIVVTPINDGPLLTVPGAQAAVEDTDLTIAGISVFDLDALTADVQFSLSATKGTLRLNGTAGLTFVAGADNSGNMTVRGPLPAVNAALSALVYRGNADANGNDSIDIVIDDLGSTGGGSLTANGSIAVNIAVVNDAPSFTKGADEAVLEDSGAHSVVGWATAILPGPPDEVAAAQTVSFNVVTNTNPGLFTVGPAIASNGDLTYTLAPDANGTATITITLQDNGGGADTSPPQSFSITVTPVNDVPSFVKGADQTVAEDCGAQTVLNWATGISPGPANEAAQTLTFSVVANTNPGLFAIAPAIAQDGNLTYTPGTDANGTATITITMQDNGGGTDTSPPQLLAITVTPVNDPPSFAKGPDQTVFEDSGAHTVLGWATSLSVGPADEAGQTLVFNLAGNTNSSLFTSGPAIAANGDLTYTLAPNAKGTGMIMLALQDDGGGIDTSLPQMFVITVLSSAPSFTSQPAATPNPAGTAQTVTLTAAANDPEGNAVTITWNFGDGVTATGGTVQHAYGAAGAYTITVTATDPQNHSSTTVFLMSVVAPAVGPGGIDSDGDGFSDALETAAGTSPNDPASTPTGTPATPPDTTGFLQTLKIALNFSKAERDSIALAGTLSLPAEFPFGGQKAIVDVGGAIITFTLDAKAKSQPKGFALRIEPRFKQFRFALKAKGSFAAALADDGLTNERVDKHVNVPVTMVFANHIFSRTFTLRYMADEGKTGKAGR